MEHITFTSAIWLPWSVWKGAGWQWHCPRAGFQYRVRAGDNTVLCQIAAEALDLPMKMCESAQPDTNQGRTAGRRLHRAGHGRRKSRAFGRSGNQANVDAGGMIGGSYSPEDFAQLRRHIVEHGELRSLARYEAPAGVFLDDEKYPRRSLCLLPGRFILQKLQWTSRPTAQEVEDS